MNEPFTILIADRNPRIREFLQRELSEEGYFTKLANDGREVLRMLRSTPPDLLILDTDIPYLDGENILKRLQDDCPAIPVVVHAFSSAEISDSSAKYPFAFIEKQGTNIDRLKSVVAQVLEEHYTKR
ncbi:MAG TPA: response regulator [Thermodesulfobacteriota bacterium]|nr:response regulator [Deltaproteobacteria bacterium]HNR12609.1 response regulator [Thermodesulfobacteriota bacterium]HQO78416.1 response regulator [Thermodesulfobacteriota bacterium]